MTIFFASNQDCLQNLITACKQCSHHLHGFRPWKLVSYDSFTGNKSDRKVYWPRIIEDFSSAIKYFVFAKKVFIISGLMSRPRWSEPKKATDFTIKKKKRCLLGSLNACLREFWGLEYSKLVLYKISISYQSFIIDLEDGFRKKPSGKSRKSQNVQEFIKREY